MERTGEHQNVLREALGRFPEASPELLSQRKLLRRTDSKFLLSQRQLGHLLPRLGDHYGLVYAGAQPIASYRTLYFDTPDLFCFHAHRRGRRPRHKVRIRHYPDRQVSFLEIKTKRSETLTNKSRKSRPYENHVLDDDDRAYVAARCNVPADALVPQVWTNFCRMTLVGLTTNERLTIDVDLELCRDDKSETLTGVVIVEVKQSPFCVRTPAMKALREAGLRPVSASKYCAATAMTRSGLRMNRLLPALRAIEKMRSQP